MLGLVAVLGSVLSGVVAPTPAGAVGGKSFTVDVLTDSVDATPGDGFCLDAAGACSLRAAVQESNALGSPANTITLAAGATYGLTRTGSPDTSSVGDLDITSAVVVEGNGATIDASALATGASPVPDRVIEVGGAASATLRAVTVKGGHSPGAESGGGIQTLGALVLDRVVLIDNVTAGHGGGVFYNSSSSGSITSSVIVHNTATQKGGGLRVNHNLTITSSTISHNTSATPSLGHGLMVGDNTTVTLKGTILDNPTTTAPNDPGGNDCTVSGTGGAISSTGWNLSRSPAAVCSLVQGTDKPSQNPVLFLDVVPPAGSPAIDAGGPTCPAVDLWGTSRPRGVACEIGAFEAPVTFAVTTTTDTVDASPGNGVCADAGGQCSLRAAVMEGNAELGPKTIQLASAATYPLTLKGLPDTSANGDLDITGPTTIEGNGSTVDAAGLVPITAGSTYGDRVLEVSSSGSATIQRLGLVNGNTDGSGGGVQVAGSLDLDRAILRDNKAAGSGGGAFYNSAATGSIATSVFVHNTAQKGGAIRANKTLSIASSTLSHNTATTPAYGHGLMVGDNATVTLTGTLIDNPTAAGAGGYDCSVSTVGGAIASAGYNLSRSAASVCRLTGTGDLPATDPGAMWLDIVPLEGSAAIDGGGPACPATDVNGLTRPQRYACDVGAIEAAETRQFSTLRSFANRTVNATNPDGTPYVAYTRELIARALARYEIKQPTLGRQDLTTLANTPYVPEDPNDPDAAPGNGITPMPAGWPVERFYTWAFEFDFIHLLRLAVVDQPTGWATDPMKPTVDGWITDHANDCHRDADGNGTFDDVYTHLYGNGTWTNSGSENHALLMSVECMLSLYANQATYGNLWTMWRDALRAWVRADARNGLLGEIMSPIYGKYSLSAIMAMADFTADTDLHDVTRWWLDVFWQDVALNYNKTSRIVGASGSRMYQFNPDGNAPAAGYYGVATSQWFRSWTWMYGWHDTQDFGAVQTIDGAASTYAPLAMSAQVANATNKAITYTSRRPAATGPGAATNPGVVRRVEQNDDYLLGAQTYDPTVTKNLGMTEGIWAGVSLNSNPDDRILISGVGESKSGHDTYTDYSGIQARLSNNVIVAARDNATEVGGTDTGNSRGIRVWFGPALRTNLAKDTNTDWWFTTSGNTFVAVRFSAPVEARQSTDTPGKTSELRISDPDGAQPNHCVGSKVPTTGCCPPTGPDCWAPVVVQVGRAAQGYTFATFKTAVLDPTRYGYNATTGVVSYRSLANENLTIARQEAAPVAPTVNGGTVSFTNIPTFAGTPYLTMAAGATTATLCSPAPATCVTRDFA